MKIKQVENIEIWKKKTEGGKLRKLKYDNDKIKEKGTRQEIKINNEK